jgi:hypothetical protein
MSSILQNHYVLAVHDARRSADLWKASWLWRCPICVSRSVRICAMDKLVVIRLSSSQDATSSAAMGRSPLRRFRSRDDATFGGRMQHRPRCCNKPSFDTSRSARSLHRSLRCDISLFDEAYDGYSASFPGMLQHPRRGRYIIYLSCDNSGRNGISRSRPRHLRRFNAQRSIHDAEYPYAATSKDRMQHIVI